MINYDVPLSARGLNANIKGHIVDNMESYGFYNTKTNGWLLIEDLGFDISITIRISNCISIDVIDEDFCQPYDYQAILKDNSTHSIALDIHQKIQSIMSKLCETGIITGYVAGDYI